MRKTNSLASVIVTAIISVCLMIVIVIAGCVPNFWSKKVFSVHLGGHPLRFKEGDTVLVEIMLDNPVPFRASALGFELSEGLVLVDVFVPDEQHSADTEVFWGLDLESNHFVHVGYTGQLSPTLDRGVFLRILLDAHYDGFLTMSYAEFVDDRLETMDSTIGKPSRVFIVGADR